MKQLLGKHKMLLVFYFIILFSGTLFFLMTNPVVLHKKINTLVGNPFMDFFFQITDLLGNGWVAFVILFILLFLKYRYFFITGISWLGASLIVNVMKYYLFPDRVRPAYIFRWIIHEPLKIVGNEDLMILHSFPSGHSAQSFAIFFCFALFSAKTSRSFLWMMLAWTGAISRVYLSQHWLGDILTGSFIGAGMAFLMSSLFLYYRENTRWDSNLLKDFWFSKKNPE